MISISRECPICRNTISDDYERRGLLKYMVMQTRARELYFIHEDAVSGREMMEHEE